MTPETCPNRNTLEKLLLGDLPPDQRDLLGEHLINCDKCAQEAETLSLTDELTVAIRNRRVFEDDDALLNEAIERGKRLGSENEAVESEATVVVKESSDDGNNQSIDVDRSAPVAEQEYDFLDPPQQADEIGRLGGYRVQEVLGVGGMGVVFRAEDPRLERIVALKAMKPAVAAGRSAKDRFLREAKATASIEHDNIVQIYQVGEDRNIPFIAMRFLRGESLQTRLKRDHRLDQREAVRIAREAAAGLDAAHQRNLIHRDIKPDNIWIEAETGRTKILDFGLARNVSEDGGLTQSGIVLGTPRYMAPEQAQGQELDHRCDLFSLGSVLYHLVAGKAPFDGGNLTATLMAVAHDDPTPIDQVASRLHPGLSKLITQLLSKDRNRRPQSASEVVTALSVIERDLEAGNIPESDETEDRTVITQPASDTVMQGEPAPFINTSSGGHRLPPRRKTGLWMWGSFAVILVLGVITFVTAKGTVELVIPPDMTDEVSVEIWGEHDRVEVLDKQNHWRVKLASGKYQLEMKGGNHRFHLQENTLTVTRFGRAEVRMTYKPNEVDVENHALSFDGKDDYVEIPNPPEWRNGPLTLEATVHSELVGQDLPAVLDLVGFKVRMNRPGFQWMFIAFGPAERTVLIGEPYMPLQQKLKELSRDQHLAAVYDQRSISLFINGQLRARAPIPEDFTVRTAVETGYIGNSFVSAEDSFFAGKIDELRISNTVRYTEDYTPTARLEDDEQTLALYHFDEGKGDVLKDSSGNGHDGKIVGAKWVRADDELNVIEPSSSDWHGWPADAPPPAIAPFDAAQAKAHQEAWAKYLGIPVEYENSIGMKFRLIPPGEFLMGSTPEEVEAALEVTGQNQVLREQVRREAPQHKVVLTKPLYVGVTEVTQAQYEQVMGTNPSHFAATGEEKEEVANLETGNHPVETVSWNDAAEFCAKLSQQEQLKLFYLRAGETVTLLEGNGYRLPTEAEWEYACRAGTTTRFWSGDENNDLLSAAWFVGNSLRRTHTVGELRSNPFGLSDVHGNVWEWVQDSWDPAFYGKFTENAAVDPFRPYSNGSSRVLRGGVFHGNPSRCRSTDRHAALPLWRAHDIGFRVVLVAEGLRVSRP